MTRRRMPDEPHGDHVVSEEVFDHIAVETFKNAAAAFAVCVDDDKGAVWITRRGRDPDMELSTDIILAFACRAAESVIRGLSDGPPDGSVLPPRDDR